MSVHRFGVVGAGIVGLAVARRIRSSSGTQVTVLEEGGPGRRPPDRPQQWRGSRRAVLRAGLPEGDALPSRGEPCCRSTARREEAAVRRVRQVGRRDRRVRAARAGADPAARAGQRCTRRRARWATPDCGRSSRTPPGWPRSSPRGPRSPTTSRSPSAYADDVRAAGGSIEFRLPGRRDHAARRQGGGGPLGRAFLKFDRLVVCAGLQSDQVATWAGDDAGPAIAPFRGEYFRLIPERNAPGPGAHLSGSQPRLPVSRRALHQAGRRRSTSGQTPFSLSLREGYTRGASSRGETSGTP